MYRVIVNDDQLSLAIGKEGQNARLAAKLTGFKIDIKPASAENNETEADTAKDEDTIITDAHEAEAADAAEAPLE
ncbi:transcription termination factor NusA [Ruminococcus sp. CAG:382]|nr:transcription termination factor NusA [Ruminococcus sp. CAG:382]